MSQTSDLISNEDDLPNSPATFSEKYTDEESPSFTECGHNHDNEDGWLALSEVDSLPGPSWAHVCQHGHHHHHHHHQFEYDPDYHECQHGHDWSNVTMSDDEIEIITDPNYFRHNDVFYIDPLTARSLLSDLLIREPSANLHIHVDRRSKRQRFVARAVMIISMTMFTVSVLLVMISLIMSDHIDDMVRNANSLLHGGGQPTKEPMSSSTKSMISSTSPSYNVTMADYG